MQISAAAALRRVRIRSWKDLVAIIAMGLLYYGICELLKRTTRLDDSKIRIIATIVAVILGVIILFAIRR